MVLWHDMKGRSGNEKKTDRILIEFVFTFHPD